MNRFQLGGRMGNEPRKNQLNFGARGQCWALAEVCVLSVLLVFIIFTKCISYRL